MIGEDEIDEKIVDEMKNYISSGAAGIRFGVFTMSVMHWKSRSGSGTLPELVDGVFVISVVFLVLCAQILLPVVFVSYHWENYNGGICPSSGTAKARVAMFAVAALYTAKLIMRMIDSFREHIFAYSKWRPDVAVSSLDSLNNLDVTWTLVWEGAIYMMNLWVIFLADNVEDMVLNCLAGEFMTQVDGEIVALYLKIYDIDGKAYVLADRKNTGSISGCWKCLSFFIGHLLSFSYTLIAIITLVFGPMCKP